VKNSIFCPTWFRTFIKYQLHRKSHITVHNDSRSPHGDCGFFVSTKIWTKPIAPIFPNDIFIYRSFCRMIGAFISRGFLFALFEDKPIFIHTQRIPRCRSPPAPFDFSQFKKNRMEASPMKNQQKSSVLKKYFENFSKYAISLHISHSQLKASNGKGGVSRG